MGIYSAYLISSFGTTTAIGLANLLNSSYRHNKITAFFSKENYTSKDLLQEVTTTIRKIKTPQAVLIVDNAFTEKQYSDENELIC